jgi:hypothetical protein
MATIEINKENILFEDHMNYDTEKRVQAEALNDSNFYKMRKIRIGMAILNRFFLTMAIINLAMAITMVRYLPALLSAVTGLFILISDILVWNVINKKLMAATNDLFITTRTLISYDKADKYIGYWRDIEKRIDKKSTMLNFSRDNDENVSINAFWVDDDKKAHNEIFHVHKDLVEYTENRKVLIKLICPLNEENYIRLCLPK